MAISFDRVIGGKIHAGPLAMVLLTRVQISGSEGQNRSEAVTKSEGAKSGESIDAEGLFPAWSLPVAKKELERAKGFEPCAQKSEPLQQQFNPQNSQSDCTQIRAQISGASCPDLAKVVAAWAKLSAPLKAAIVAIIATNEDHKEATQ